VHRDVAVWTFWGAVFTAALLYQLGRLWEEQSKP
jgi:hypothetical protein